MASKQLARRGTSAVATVGAPDSLREVIRQALNAYELALATRLKAEREATAARGEYLHSVAELERRTKQEREQDTQSEHGLAAAQAARIEMLARITTETEQAAVRLLEAAALAHVRGVGDALAGPVQPHAASDEQAAAAFTAAQTAAAALRVMLLTLAGAHLESGDWEAARAIVGPLHDETVGALHDEAAALLRATYRAQAASAIVRSDWEQARAVVESALSVSPGSLGADPVLTRQFARAMSELAAAATASDRPDDAERHIAVARERLGDDHPGLRDLTRRVLGWAGAIGPLTCLHEFGGHRQPVLDVAFTVDGEQLVSVDGDQIKTWRLSGTSGPINTTAAPGAFQLTSDARLAVTTDGALLRTDGSPACTLTGATAGSVTAFASSADGSVVAWASREPEPSRKVWLSGDYGYQPGPGPGYGQNLDPSDAQMFVPLRFPHRLTQRPLRNAMQVVVQQNGVRYAACRLVRSLHVADGRTGKEIRSVKVATNALILSLALSPSADFVAWLQPAGLATVTDIAVGLMRYTFSAATSQTSYDTIAVSPQDRLVAIAQARLVTRRQGRGPSHGWESIVMAWDVTTGSQVLSWTFPGVTGGIAFSPDERFIAALTTEGNVALYDIRAGAPLAAEASHGGADYPHIAFSPDGSRLVTSGNRTIKVWGIPS